MALTILRISRLHGQFAVIKEVRVPDFECLYRLDPSTLAPSSLSEHNKARLKEFCVAELGVEVRGTPGGHGYVGGTMLPPSVKMRVQPTFHIKPRLFCDSTNILQTGNSGLEGNINLAGTRLEIPIEFELPVETCAMRQLTPSPPHVVDDVCICCLWHSKCQRLTERRGLSRALPIAGKA